MYVSNTTSVQYPYYTNLLALALYFGRCCCIGIRRRFQRLLPRPNVFDNGPVGGRRAEAARWAFKADID